MIRENKLRENKNLTLCQGLSAAACTRVLQELTQIVSFLIVTIKAQSPDPRISALAEPSQSWNSTSSSVGQCNVDVTPTITPISLSSSPIRSRDMQQGLSGFVPDIRNGLIWLIWSVVSHTISQLWQDYAKSVTRRWPSSTGYTPSLPVLTAT